jgi:hypothetical protein
MFKKKESKIDNIWIKPMQTIKHSKKILKILSEAKILIKRRNDFF